MDCLGAEEGGKDVPANEPCPMDLVGLFPSAPAPQPPDPGGSSCSETTPTAPKGPGASGLEELLKAPWAPRLQVMGFPPPASFLRVTPPMMKAPPQHGVAGIGMCPGDRGKEGRRNWTQASGVSSGAFHSN